INAKIFTGVGNYSRAFKRLDLLIAGEEKLVKQLDDSNFLIENSINIYVVAMAVLMIVVIILMATWVKCQKRKWRSRMGRQDREAGLRTVMTLRNLRRRLSEPPPIDQPV